jgi:hypothetical protein
VVRVLKEVRVGRVPGLVLLADRQLRQLPERFGRTCGLFVLDVLQNQRCVMKYSLLPSIWQIRLVVPSG